LSCYNSHLYKFHLVEKLILFSRQIIAGALTLLLLIGQFAFLEHSVEHPFHQADDHCATFIHCEKQDLATAFDKLKLKFSVLVSEKYISIKQPDNVHFSPAYSSRAPPFIS